MIDKENGRESTGHTHTHKHRRERERERERASKKNPENHPHPRKKCENLSVRELFLMIIISHIQ